MERPSATGYTHQDNVSGSYQFERSEFRVEERRPAYYRQNSAHNGDSTADGYHGPQSAAVTQQYSGVGYLHSDRDNCVYFLPQQVNYKEESIFSSTGVPSLQSTGIIPDIIDIIPNLYDSSGIGQHSAPRNSYLEYSSYTCSSDQQYINNEMNILAFSGQHSLENTGVTPVVKLVPQSMLTIEHHSAAQCPYLQSSSEAYASLQTNSIADKNISALSGLSHVRMIQDIHPLSHTVLPSVQHPLGQERRDEMIDYRPHSSNCNNINSIEQSRIYSYFKHNTSKNVKGVTAMKRNDIIPLFATGMELHYESEVQKKNSSNSPSNPVSLKSALSVSDHQVKNFPEKLQDVNGTYKSSHTNKIYGDEQVTEVEDRIIASLKEGIQQGKIVINESENTFFCTICNRFFRTRYPRAHWEIFHLEKWFECRICSKRFGSFPLLKKHKIAHSVKRYACNKCKYRSAWKCALVKHMTTHFKKRSFVCGKCTRSFRLQCNLNIHLRNCNSNS